MANWVSHRGKLWSRSFFEPSADSKAGACPRCGDLGLVPASISDERYDVLVPCNDCRIFCQPCQRWVRRSGHECKTA